MPKRILLYFACLLCVIGNAEEIESSSFSSSSEIGKWRTFIGIEGGVGLNNYYRNYFILAYANPLFSKPNGSAIGYHLALNLGWQKYLNEIVGTRLSLNLGGQYVPKIGIETDKTTQDFKNGYGWEFGFVNDWIFNFTSQQKTKFGMLLGFGLDFYDHIDFSNPNYKSATIFLLNARIGFSTQIKNNIIDLYFSIPAISLISVANKIDSKYYLHYTNALTLGYKYLF